MSEFKLFVTLDDVETQVFPWGRLQWMNEKRVTGTSNMTTGVVTLECGMGHDRHNHEGSEEILYVLEGEGEQTIEIEGEIITKIIKKGELIYIPDGAMHSTVNIGDKPMELLAVYQFAGPESFLRALPECEIEPPVNSLP